MKPKAFGTCSNPVYEPLRWGCDAKLANKICAHNRHYAEHSGYFEKTNFLKEVDREHATTFYDPMTLKPLFCAPQDRTFKEFELESRQHGWPSFRDKEVNWENVRVLPDGEVVSITGTHLGTLHTPTTFLLCTYSTFIVFSNLLCFQDITFLIKTAIGIVLTLFALLAIQQPPQANVVIFICVKSKVIKYEYRNEVT